MLSVDAPTTFVRTVQYKLLDLYRKMTLPSRRSPSENAFYNAIRAWVFRFWSRRTGTDWVWMRKRLTLTEALRLITDVLRPALAEAAAMVEQKALYSAEALAAFDDLVRYVNGSSPSPQEEDKQDSKALLAALKDLIARFEPHC
jgi:hypothetical protein